MLARALDLALTNEARGGLPVGAVISLDDRIIAEGASEVPGPPYHPGRHAEMQALAAVDVALWPRAAAMTVYTTLEPCLMCFGACRDTGAAVEAVKKSGLKAVVYEEVNNPFGIGVLTMSEDPADFTGPVRRLFQGQPFAAMRPMPVAPPVTSAVFSATENSFSILTPAAPCHSPH